MNLFGLLVPAKWQHHSKLKKFMNIYENLLRKMPVVILPKKFESSMEVRFVVSINQFSTFDERIGSVSGSNCKELAQQPDIDGFLVGGLYMKTNSIIVYLDFFPRCFAQTGIRTDLQITSKLGEELTFLLELNLSLSYARH